MTPEQQAEQAKIIEDLLDNIETQCVVAHIPLSDFVIKMRKIFNKEGWLTQAQIATLRKIHRFI